MSSQEDQRDRTILPPPESPFKGKIETAMRGLNAGLAAASQVRTARRKA